jgi:transposase
MFAQDASAWRVAGALRVSTKSVYQWRRVWQAGGEAALASKSAGGNPCKLDESQLAHADHQLPDKYPGFSAPVVPGGLVGLAVAV